MRQSLLLLSSCAVLFTVGCASTLQQRIPGTYRSEVCESMPDGNGGTTYFTRTFELTQDQWTIDFSTYGEEGCAARARIVAVDIGGGFTLGVEGTGPKGSTPGEFEIARRSITPLNDGVASYFNSVSLCGISTWTANQPQDVLQQGCAQFGMHPLASCAKEHDLVKLDGQRLYFGARPADGNLCTPERRPTTLGSVATVLVP